MSCRSLSRRDFLRGAATFAGGLVLAACGGGGAQDSQVRIMVDSWALAYAPFKQAAESYNALHPEAQVKIEPSPGGWMTKVIGQIRSDELQWSAAGVLTSFSDLAVWVQLGLIQPIDTYLAASAEPAAASFVTDMLPPVKEDQSLNGQMYGIPFSVENITYQWNTEWAGKAGITAPPKTWQELYDYAGAVKDVLAAEGNTETHALGFDLGNLARNLGSLLCSISDHPYTADGWLDWDSDEMRESLRLMRKLSAGGLTPPNCGEGLEIYDLWKRGRLAGLMSCSSRGLWAQKTLGFDKVVTSRLPTFDGDPHAGSVFWSNSMTLLNNAPLPQAAMDFLIYALGPQNLDWHRACIQAGTSPAFASVYPTLIEGDPDLAAYRWMTELRDDIAISVPAPKTYYYQVQNEAWNLHRPDYLKDGSTMTEDELIRSVLASCDEILAEVLRSVPTPVP